MERLPIDNDPARWNPVIYLYCLYHLIMLGGGGVGHNLNLVAAVIFMSGLYVCFWRYIPRLRLDKVFFCLLVSMVVPMIPIVFSSDYSLEQCSQELGKYYALNFVILLGLALPFLPVSRNRRGWVLILAILVFQVLGWLLNDGVGMHADRVKGFLANPNSFALSAMMMLFLVDEASDPPLVRWTTYLVVLVFTYVSRTGGAIIGVASGLCHKFLNSGKRLSLARSVLLVTILLLIAVIFLSIPEGTFSAVDNTLLKIKIFQDNFEIVLAGKKINYLSIIQKTGNAENSSLAWRFSHWTRVVVSFLDAPLSVQLFGAGVGMSEVKFLIKPHNDYLRMLYETGIVGFASIITMWFTIYRRMVPRYRWLALMVAVYSFSENNYDHFPAISLLILYMLSTNRLRLAGATEAAPLEEEMVPVPAPVLLERPTGRPPVLLPSPAPGEGGAAKATSPS